MLPALGDLKVETSSPDAIEICLLALIIARGANEQARRCNDVLRRVIEHVVDLDLHQDNLSDVNQVDRRRQSG